MKKQKLTPFVKWAGGKRQLLEEIEKRMPKKFNNLIEPFVGGGAVFLHFQNNKSIINDLSEDLMNTYKQIKNSPSELMSLLDEYEKQHALNPEKFYYEIRRMDRDINWFSVDSLTKAARLIYLNKACFNGLYRVNSKGQFNVPFNKKPIVKTYDKENIFKISNYLNSSVILMNNDFEEACKLAKPGDFVFLDPPYDLLNSSTFDSYTKDGFGEDGQRRLAKIAHELRDRGVYVMLTNHDTELINELYSDFTIDVVEVKRMINRNASKRTGVETIIYGYKLSEEV